MKLKNDEFSAQFSITEDSVLETIEDDGTDAINDDICVTNDEFCIFTLMN